MKVGLGIDAGAVLLVGRLKLGLQGIRRLGPCLQDGTKASFRIQEEQFDFLDLQAELGNRVQSVRWRRPNLNDVFLWINDPNLSGSVVV